MKNKELENFINKAEEQNSYLIVGSIRDENKSDNDLTHYSFRQNFPTDDIIPSIDQAVRTMGIVPHLPVSVIKPKIEEGKDLKPLKIGIFTHFNRAPESYSPARAVKNQVKLLQKFGHEVVFFTQEGSKLDLGCEMKPIVTKFKRQKGVIDEEAKEKFKEVLKKELDSSFDIAITHDFYLDDCVTYREAIKECGIDIPWLHWARSGVGRPIDFKMPNARYVYMNFYDAGHFASKIGVDSDRVRVVFNEKDPEFLFNWDPVTKMIVNKLKLWEKDIIQVFPLCSTRKSAKGINSVIRIFGELKKQGKKVALIICNANGRRRVDELKSDLEYGKECGLDENDFVFTSLLADDEHDIANEVKNRVVTELMQISNLFIFPTIAEVCSNVLLEASMTNNLLVINEDLPLLFDFVDRDAVLAYPFTSLQSLHYKKFSSFYKDIAEKIISELDYDKTNLQFRRVWNTHNIDNIYHKMLAPILYENI